MKSTADAERIRKALGSRDKVELEWALSHARERADASDEELKKYWEEVVRRIESALSE